LIRIGGALLSIQDAGVVFGAASFSKPGGDIMAVPEILKGEESEETFVGRDKGQVRPASASTATERLSNLRSLAKTPLSKSSSED